MINADDCCFLGHYLVIFICSGSYSSVDLLINTRLVMLPNQYAEII